MTRQERINRLARILCMESTSKGFSLSRERLLPYRWWLTGGKLGDSVLPNSAGTKTENEALDAAEAWFAPEIDQEP
jgi:hypothetical protein